MSNGMALSQEDNKLIEETYRMLSELQRKTLTFLQALGEYEQKWRLENQRGNEKEMRPSRMAFIVTPLMVNHYNHMHHVYRASMYGKVPDLCDQTGGIMCTDLSSLRKELASCTTDVNRSLTTTFHTTILPNVRFDFKTTRDNVLESALRLLDSMNVKQPDLTQGIRDDYVQNVRAIQESLTGALEKSKERTAELQTRLDDALRKLKLCEKTMLSTNNNAATEDALRRDVLKLKNTVLEQQKRLVEQEVSFNERFLDLVRSNEESELLRRLKDRLEHRLENETEGLVKMRQDILEFAEKEIDQIKTNFSKMREDMIAYASKVLTRSSEEREETQKIFNNLLSRDDDFRGGGEKSYNELLERFTQVNEQMAGLSKENEVLKNQITQFELQGELLLKDLKLFCDYFTQDLEAATNFAGYVYSKALMVYSPHTTPFIQYLQTVLTDESIKTYVETINMARVEARAEEIIGRSGMITEMMNRQETILQYQMELRRVLKVMTDVYKRLTNTIPNEDLSISNLLEFFHGLPEMFLRIENEKKNLLDRIEDFKTTIKTYEAEKSAIQDFEISRLDQVLNTLDGDPTIFDELLKTVYTRPISDNLRKILYSTYCAYSVQNLNKYETEISELKLYHLVDYDVLTKFIHGVFDREEKQLTELENPRLNNAEYFLDYFINQLGNVHIESFVKSLSLRERNHLMSLLFERYYIPVINKQSFVTSLEGPFANFSMVYKTQ